MCLWGGACGDAVTSSVTSSGSTTPPSCRLDKSSVGNPPSRRRKGNAASVRKWREQCAISKFASGQSPTSSRQGVLVCGALRLPHDLICLPLLFPQNSLRDFCGNPERRESAFSPLKKAPIIRNFTKLGKRFLTPRREDFPKGKICGEISSRNLFCEAKEIP